MSRTLTPRSCVIRSRVIALAGLLWLLPVAACSGKQEPAQTAQLETTESEEPAEAGQDAQATDSAPESGAAAGTQEPSAPADASLPLPPERSEAPAASTPPIPPSGPPAAAPPQAPPNVADPAPAPPGGIVAVPATKPGITRVGAEKCKLCHKVEHESWAATAHATRTPPLDCESCHGPGSEYKTISIMKDPEKARAAGLVIPEKSFCTDNCHASKWQDDMLKRAHARKAKAVQG